MFDEALNTTMQMLDASSGEELVLLLVLLAGGISILAVTLWTGVPPMPTNSTVRRVLLDLVPRDPAPKTIVDLGAGWGGLAFALAKEFPDARVIGIELSPLPWAWCRLRQLLSRQANVEFRLGDFMRTPFPETDLVVCYLMAYPMRKLGEKLKRDLAPGTPVLSNAFAIHEWKAEEVVMVSDAMRSFVYRYRVPGASRTKCQDSHTGSKPTRA